MQKKTQQVSVLFAVLATLFTTCLMAANLFALKQFSFGPVNFTGALLVFPISYIINDVVAEVWGFRRARMLIWMAFGMNFLFVMLGAAVDSLPESGGGIVFGVLGGLVRECGSDVENEGVEQGALVCAARRGQHAGRGVVRLGDFLPYRAGRDGAMEGDAEFCAVAGGAEDALRTGGAACDGARGACCEEEGEHRRV